MREVTAKKRDHGSQPVLLSSFYCTGIISATCIAWLGFLKKVLDEIFCAVIYCIYELQDVKTCHRNSLWDRASGDSVSADS